MEPGPMEATDHQGSGSHTSRVLVTDRLGDREAEKPKNTTKVHKWKPGRPPGARKVALSQALLQRSCSRKRKLQQVNSPQGRKKKNTEEQQRPRHRTLITPPIVNMLPTSA
ncbi:hypothetical protein F2Q69_00025811 [Brassica cretica]|uniref:Uncharacterized protein n=1 Tax=Brassica cretica TaxID=69181 RepID=A0A8S9S250_BRACR|nr:hypothetical protein F2Q69_00025811 [Brassica cretica]